MRTIAWLLGAVLAAGCGSGNGVSTGDAGNDAAPASGTWVWQSDVPATGTLVAVWASGATDAWAGGDDGLLLHWDGQAWSVVDAGTTNHIASIWGSGPSDVWAAAGGLGGPNTANLVRWNGSAWSPVDAGTTMNLKSVWGTGPNDVWAAGASGVAGTIQHFDGSSWSNAWSSVETAPQGLFGSSSNDIWIVGAEIYPTDGDHFILHGAGGSFSDVASGVTQYLRSGFSAGPSDAWAIGLGGLLHWNGSAWSAATSPLAAGDGGVWGLSSSFVLAASGRRIAQWNGATWTTVHDDDVGATLSGVGGADATHLWAVGDDATIFRFDTTVTGTPSCTDVRGQCGASCAQGHVSDYACGGSSTCCVAATACGGAEPACCDGQGNPGPRAICHDGAFYCPSPATPCPQHP